MRSASEERALLKAWKRFDAPDLAMMRQTNWTSAFGQVPELFNDCYEAHC